jgi:PAS domain S-box-containing protein
MVTKRISKSKKKKSSAIPRKQKPKVPDFLRNHDYKKIYDESPTPQRTINTKGTIISCNDAYAHAFGYTKKEIIGKSIFAFVPKESTAAMQESFETWKKNGIVEDRKVWFKKKDGSTFPGLISANNIYDNKGILIGSNTSIRDVSEIYTAHAKLEEREHQLREQFERLEKANNLLSLTEQKYRNLYEKSPVLLRTIDFEGHITDCNEAYTKALGYTRDEIIGITIYDHTAEKSISSMKDEFEEWRKTHHVTQREIWMKRKDGSIFPSLLSGGSLYDEQGRVVGRTVALMGMTEIFSAREKLEKSEKQLRDQYEQLQKLSSLKDDFLTMITHELKTPLVPIKGYVDILVSEKLGTLNPEQQKRLEIIRSSTNSLLKLISDLLDAQKLELGLLKMSKDIHDLSEIIRNTVNKMKPNTDKKGITVTAHLEDSLPFFCDQVRMEQVISNLINNSLDFCEPNAGRIDINLQNEGSVVKITVKDNGIGILKESLDKIFVKFFQVDTSMTREHGGTGIGLSVCRGIVEGHGGKIWAESEGRNKGAEIHILLPKFR